MNEIWGKLLNVKRLNVSKRKKEGDPRTEFDSDFGRVIFSPAVRRMHDKTQVFPLTADDNIHSRLTHSMEVLSIGYSLGLRLINSQAFQQKTGISDYSILRCVPVIIQNACLVHDIGNPPFGHFGETVIQEYFASRFDSGRGNFSLSDLEKVDFEKFDGNAQGFRVLTKLQSLNEPFGLNLTAATLASYLKYPNSNAIDKRFLVTKKRGVFQSEKKQLDDIMADCGLIKPDGSFKRHPFAFIMEAADSICYLVMDIEDGYNKHWYNYDFLKSQLGILDGMATVFENLEKEYVGFGAEYARIVNLRIAIIGYLMKVAILNFETNFDAIIDGSYNKELIFDDPSGVAEALQKFCRHNIFSQKEIQSLELTGHSVITGLLDYYIDFLFNKKDSYTDRAEGLISSSVKRAAFLEHGFDETRKLSNLNDYFKLRVIVDFISGMTDQYALDHFQRLSGQRLN